MRVRLWCDRGSDGLINLKNALVEAGVDCKRIKVNSATYRPKLDHLIINWGNSQHADWDRSQVGDMEYINDPYAVKIASNKLRTFNTLSGVDIPIPKYEAGQNLCGESHIHCALEAGKIIFCRTQLTGHSGAGIVIATRPEELVPAPLYTVGVPNGGEWRIHVFRNLNGEPVVIDVVKKRRRTELQEQGEINNDIRNLVGGWVYCHNNVSLPDSVHDMARQAISALGLDFGAVDIIKEKNTDNYYTLEVNSAPGLQSPTTLAAYVTAIKEIAEI